MFAVIFEVMPKPEYREAYLGIAAALRPDLERIDGFLANERFRSLSREGLVLSSSLWRDEEALLRWRNHAPHRRAQARGRDELFAGYPTYRADRLRHRTRWLPAALTATAGRLFERLGPTTHSKVGFDYKLRQFLSGHGLDARRAHHHHTRP